MPGYEQNYTPCNLCHTTEAGNMVCISSRSCVCTRSAIVPGRGVVTAPVPIHDLTDSERTAVRRWQCGKRM